MGGQHHIYSFRFPERPDIPIKMRTCIRICNVQRSYATPRPSWHHLGRSDWTKVDQYSSRIKSWRECEYPDSQLPSEPTTYKTSRILNSSKQSYVIESSDQPLSDLHTHCAHWSIFLSMLWTAGFPAWSAYLAGRTPDPLKSVDSHWGPISLFSTLDQELTKEWSTGVIYEEKKIILIVTADVSKSDLISGCWLLWFKWEFRWYFAPVSSYLSLPLRVPEPSCFYRSCFPFQVSCDIPAGVLIHSKIVKSIVCWLYSNLVKIYIKLFDRNYSDRIQGASLLLDCCP